MAIDQNKKRDIINSIQKKLAEKNRTLICSVCGNNNFILADGFIQDSLQNQLGSFTIGGPSIPAVIVICSHCGHTIRFSLGVLGLINEIGGSNNDKK